jgi:hypothetical protein
MCSGYSRGVGAVYPTSVRSWTHETLKLCVCVCVCVCVCERAFSLAGNGFAYGCSSSFLVKISSLNLK